MEQQAQQAVDDSDTKQDWLNKAADAIENGNYPAYDEAIRNAEQSENRYQEDLRKMFRGHP